ncbi:MAG: transposase family protein, partial [Treponema sp.]|nr:transposase family protein [Treponema sp.]
MGRKKRKKGAREAEFKRLFGVEPETFEKMKAILQKGFDRLHRKGGSPPKLTVEDKLKITLRYLREYRTMESIAADYDVKKSTVCESIRWV